MVKAPGKPRAGPPKAAWTSSRSGVPSVGSFPGPGELNPFTASSLSPLSGTNGCIRDSSMSKSIRVHSLPWRLGPSTSRGPAGSTPSGGALSSIGGSRLSGLLSPLSRPRGPLSGTSLGPLGSGCWAFLGPSGLKLPFPSRMACTTATGSGGGARATTGGRQPGPFRGWGVFWNVRDDGAPGPVRAEAQGSLWEGRLDKVGVLQEGTSKGAGVELGGRRAGAPLIQHQGQLSLGSCIAGPCLKWPKEALDQLADDPVLLTVALPQCHHLPP